MTCLIRTVTSECLILAKRSPVQFIQKKCQLVTHLLALREFKE